MKMPWITPINDELIAKIEANDPTFHYLALYSNAGADKKVSSGIALRLMLENMLNKKKVDWKTLPDDMRLKQFMQTLAQPIAILQSPSLRM